MNLKNVLVLYKKSTYQIQAEEYKDERFLQLLKEGHESVIRVKRAHEEHLASIKSLEEELHRREISFKALARQDFDSEVSDVDMVISVGGDGTFLDASHCIDDIPILGINSSTSSSVGHFCLAKQSNLASVLDQIQDDRLTPSSILRLELVLNGKVLPETVLNEVLVSHSNPAATSRYLLSVGDVKEDQKSSGIWIGTAAGSTGSLRSAGGQVQTITDDHFQYLVREPYMRPREEFRNLSGLLDKTTAITVVSQMRTGTLYVDGPHIMHHFGLGDEVIIRPAKHNLCAFIDERVNDMFKIAVAAGVKSND